MSDDDTRDRIKAAARPGWISVDRDGKVVLLRPHPDVAAIDVFDERWQAGQVYAKVCGNAPQLRDFAAQLVAVADALEPEPIVLFHMPDTCPECGVRVTSGLPRPCGS